LPPRAGPELGGRLRNQLTTYRLLLVLPQQDDHLEMVERNAVTSDSELFFTGWAAPELRVRVQHPKGGNMLRHASLREIQ
jgi:hypothetical protein